VAQLKCSQH